MSKKNRQNILSDIIRSSRHYFNEANTSKQQNLSILLIESRRVLQYYIDYIWNNRIETSYLDKKANKQVTIITDIQNKEYTLPKYLEVNSIIVDSHLTHRLKRCLLDQAKGIIKATLAKINNFNYGKEQLILQNKNITKIQEKIDKISFSCPIINDKTPIEITSNIGNLIESDDFSFDAFLKLTSISTEIKKILLPIKYTKVYNKWNAIGKKLNSFRLYKNCIEIRFKFYKEKKEIGEKLGIDTGINYVYSCSDNQQSTPDSHNHTLLSILQKINRKTQGSKSYNRSLQHRKNYINWAFKQLDLTNVKEIHLEDIFNKGFKKKQGKFFHHFSVIEIEKALVALAEEHGVQIIFKPSYYRSQRCNKCGFVCSKNRVGEKFNCGNCGHSDHSDLNAAKNQLLDLPSTYALRQLLKEAKSFFYMENGLFNLEGQEYIVPDIKEKK